MLGGLGRNRQPVGGGNSLLTGLVLGYDPVGQGSGSDLTDYSGNGNTGTFHNSPTFDGSGLTFSDADGDYVSVTYTATDEMTFFMRAKYTTLEALWWYWGFWGDDDNEFSLFYAGDGPLSYGSWSDKGTVTLSTIDTFYNYAATAERTSDTEMTVKLYIDGSLAGTKTSSNFKYPTPPTTLYLSHAGRGAFHLTGTIATFATWSRLLTTDEIAALEADPLVWKP